MKKILLAFLLAAGALPALAQEQDDYTLIGVAVRSRPHYDGLDSRTLDVIPVLRYYGQTLFARSTQGILEGGARALLGEGSWGQMRAGAQLAYEQGPRDKNHGASIGFHLEWDGKLGDAPVDFIARVRHYLDNERGRQVDLRANVGVYRGGGALLGLFTQFTFANGENTRAYFGVSNSGHLFTDFGAWGSYDLTRQWVLVSNIHWRRLNDDVSSRALYGNEQTALYASVGLAYKF